MYCSNCGQKLLENAIACTKCGLAPHAEKNFCTHCGKAIANPKQVMCVGCGNMLELDAPPFDKGFHRVVPKVNYEERQREERAKLYTNPYGLQTNLSVATLIERIEFAYFLYAKATNILFWLIGIYAVYLLFSARALYNGEWHLLLLCFLGANCVLSCYLLYKFWESMPVASAKTTPEKAVFFMFIPFFNIYWMYVAWYTLGEQLDCILLERNFSIKSGRMLWLFALIAICIPFIGALGYLILSYYGVFYYTLAVRAYLMDLRNS